MLTKTQQSLNDVFDVVDLNVFDKEETKSETLPQIASEENLPAEVDKDATVESEDQQIKKEISDDFAFARENLKDLISKGQDLFEGAKAIAESSEDPKALEAAGSILKSLCGMNKDLLSLTRQKQVVLKDTRAIKQAIKQASGAPTQQITNVQNNVLFNGTSAELLELIKNNA